MTTGVQRSARRSAERAEAVSLADDGWAWAVIFTSAALSALSLAVLFSVTTS